MLFRSIIPDAKIKKEIKKEKISELLHKINELEVKYESVKKDTISKDENKDKRKQKKKDQEVKQQIKKEKRKIKTKALNDRISALEQRKIIKKEVKNYLPKLYKAKLNGENVYIQRKTDELTRDIFNN